MQVVAKFNSWHGFAHRICFLITFNKIEPTYTISLRKQPTVGDATTVFHAMMSEKRAAWEI